MIDRWLLMNKLKASVGILTAITLALTTFVIYCYVKAVIYAPQPPQPGQIDGIWYDPSLEAWRDYSNALRALQPYMTFLDYVWIIFAILSILWIAVGIRWFRTKRKRKLPEESLSLRGVTTTFSRWFARRAGIIWVPTTLTSFTQFHTSALFASTSPFMIRNIYDYRIWTFSAYEGYILIQ